MRTDRYLVGDRVELRDDFDPYVDPIDVVYNFKRRVGSGPYTVESIQDFYITDNPPHSQLLELDNGERINGWYFKPVREPLELTEPLKQALQFATQAHKGQSRWYTSEPYIAHPVRVALTLREAGEPEPVQIAALLHDTVEDCGITLKEIEQRFGTEVAGLVWETTNCKHRPETRESAAPLRRRERKALDRDFLAKASPAGQSIKLADMIDNVGSIQYHDPSFAYVYLPEQRALLTVMTKGNPKLRATLGAILERDNAKR